MKRKSLHLLPYKLKELEIDFLNNTYKLVDLYHNLKSNFKNTLIIFNFDDEF